MNLSSRFLEHTPLVNLRLWVWIILSGFTLVQCSSYQGSANNRRVRVQCPPRSSDDYFFAALEGVVKGPGVVSRYLNHMNEPSLSCGDDSRRESYRLVLGGPETILVVRMTAADAGATLSSFRGRLTNRSDVLESLSQSTKAVSATEWSSLKATIADSGFWTSPGDVAQNPVDGIELVEGRRGGEYRVLTRVGLGPHENKVPMVAGRLLALAGFN